MTRQPPKHNVGVHTPDCDGSDGLLERPISAAPAFAGSAVPSGHLPEDGIYTPEPRTAAGSFQKAGDSARADMCTAARPADDGAGETNDEAAIAAGFYDTYPEKAPKVITAPGLVVTLPPPKGVFPALTTGGEEPRQPDTFDI